MTQIYKYDEHKFHIKTLWVIKLTIPLKRIKWVKNTKFSFNFLEVLLKTMILLEKLKKIKYSNVYFEKQTLIYPDPSDVYHDRFHFIRKTKIYCFI